MITPAVEDLSTFPIGEAPQPAHKGPTREQSLQFLFNSQKRMISATQQSMGEDVRAQAELAFVRRCVGTILCSAGRAEYPTSRVSVKPTTPNEHVLMQDNAVIRFSRGEFPSYDIAFDRVLAKGSVERPADFDDQLKLMQEWAVSSLDIPTNQSR